MRRRRPNARPQLDFFQDTANHKSPEPHDPNRARESPGSFKNGVGHAGDIGIFVGRQKRNEIRWKSRCGWKCGCECMSGSSPRPFPRLLLEGCQAVNIYKEYSLGSTPSPRIPVTTGMTLHVSYGKHKFLNLHLPRLHPGALGVVVPRHMGLERSYSQLKGWSSGLQVSEIIHHLPSLKLTACPRK